MKPGQLPRLSGNFPGEKLDCCSCKRDTKIGLELQKTQGKEESGWLRGEKNGTFSEAFGDPRPLHSIPAGVCLASMWEACCCRVNSPWLPALTSQRANECRASGDSRACYLVLIDWSKARWRHCQLEARIPGQLWHLALQDQPQAGERKNGSRSRARSSMWEEAEYTDWRPGKAMFWIWHIIPRIIGKTQ